MKRPGFIDHRLIRDAWPQRRIGAIDTAPVLVLAANPGWDEADRAWENKLAASLRENLVGRLPNLFLDPLAHGSPGAQIGRAHV